VAANFEAFFRNINPSPTWRGMASSQYDSISTLLETASNLSSELRVQCRTQGSYDRHTSIHSINDIDILAFCTGLHFPPQPSFGWATGPGWTRDRLFNAFEYALSQSRYKHSLVQSNANSMCVKLDLGIKVEILPVVPMYGQSEPTGEPFYLWRPSTQAWELGYAQQHQAKLSTKNGPAFQCNFPLFGLGTDGNFIPAVKVFKHLCAIYNLNVVSFHLECLLYSIPDEKFWGSPASYIMQVLYYIADRDPFLWYAQGLNTPCADRNIFSAEEWQLNSWLQFHAQCKLWSQQALYAGGAYAEQTAREEWRKLLGSGWFPLLQRD